MSVGIHGCPFIPQFNASVHPHTGYLDLKRLDSRIVKYRVKVRDHSKLLCSVTNQIDSAKMRGDECRPYRLYVINQS